MPAAVAGLIQLRACRLCPKDTSLSLLLVLSGGEQDVRYLECQPTFANQPADSSLADLSADIHAKFAAKYNRTASPVVQRSQNRRVFAPATEQTVAAWNIAQYAVVEPELRNFVVQEVRVIARRSVPTLSSAVTLITVVTHVEQHLHQVDGNLPWRY